MIEEERGYRVFGGDESGLIAFRVKVETTDLYVRALGDLSGEALAAARESRLAIEAHGRGRPEFLTALSPLPEPEGPLHPVVAAMYEAARAAGVGPMAAVAGAVAEGVARTLAPLSAYVAVENGGDTFLIGERPVTVGVFAGSSPFTGRIGLSFEAEELPLSVCTSSGTVGPSLSFGRADAATIIAKSGALADAAASALGNRIHSHEEIEGALNHVMTIPGVLGALAVVGSHLGAVGNVRLVQLGE